MTKTKDTALVPVERIARSILILRGHRALLDAELAALYGVTTTRLNQQVRRNLRRFPSDFMFQLSTEEHTALMLQNATSKPGRGGRRKLPLAFTEHGAIMAATILNSERAVEMSIYVVRAFVQLRDLLASNKELAKRLDELEERIARKLATHDQAITGMLKTLRELMNPPEPKRRGIGFTANFDEK
ncbi:ORF6N domain-containing protein [Steroidobacter sp.]|uniref:ORF6N domain-containing protein n=1 Tax=Steroidobacter sp. TaxID=1978227 RepID=UPI001A3B0322|nr:ORF6N domain-containing protein [Steroidobacter sp.]MBL8266241.1 ORF6N domain-containing protein [Steroidobacter sp.]